MQTRSTREGLNSNPNHSNEQDWKGLPDLLSKVIFYNAGNIKEIENFLKKDIQLSQEGIPQGELWQSVGKDVKALKSLHKIEHNLNKLRVVGYKFGEMKRSFEETSAELRREVSCFPTLPQRL